jgi:hypothetical protein
MQLSLARRHVKALPWNIRRAWDQIQFYAKKYFKDVEHFMFNGAMAKGKVMSFHLKELTCFNKMKEGKELQFGRQFQLGRIGGNFMIVSPCTTIRMEDKKNVESMVDFHENLFGKKTLTSYGTDKGYYSKVNQKYLKRKKRIASVNLQRPGQDLNRLSKKQRTEKISMTNRRAGIEPLIGHIKHKGQLGRSRMKTDESTVASGYAAVGGFNLRQIIRHQLGKKIKMM